MHSSIPMQLISLRDYLMSQCFEITIFLAPVLSGFDLQTMSYDIRWRVILGPKVQAQWVQAYRNRRILMNHLAVHHIQGPALPFQAHICMLPVDRPFYLAGLPVQ